MNRRARVRKPTAGSALLEFAIVLPLLVVFIVGIYDFSGSFNQKQKISHAAQEGAVAAGAQPMTDLDSTNGDPDSLHSVVTVIANSLINDHVVPQAGCDPLAGAWVSGLQWQYRITCGSDDLTITIDRGVLVAGPPATVSTAVTVSFPYHWRFSSVIQLLIPGASYAATTDLRETATVHNQI